jgi:hypothetical protein
MMEQLSSFVIHSFHGHEFKILVTDVTSILNRRSVVLYNNVTYLNVHTDFIYIYGEFNDPNFTF